MKVWGPFVPCLIYLITRVVIFTSRVNLKANKSLNVLVLAVLACSTLTPLFIDTYIVYLRGVEDKQNKFTFCMTLVSWRDELAAELRHVHVHKDSAVQGIHIPIKTVCCNTTGSERSNEQGDNCCIVWLRACHCLYVLIWHRLQYRSWC